MLINAIPRLAYHQLTALALDCQNRIGSHVAGGDPDDRYVESQRQILSAIQDELIARLDK